MQSSFIIAILIAVLSKGTGGQEIVFYSIRIVTPCIHGLRSGVDRYTILGWAGKNYSALVSASWAASVDVDILTKDSQNFNTMCTILIGLAGFWCGPQKGGCFCDHFESKTGIAFIVIEFPAPVNHSQGIVRAHWFNKNNTHIISTNNMRIPYIYDVTATQLMLTILGVADTIRKKDSCSFTLALSVSVNLELCCSKTVRPCYPQIAFDGAVVASNISRCVNYTSTIDDGIVNVELFYSLCTQNDYKLGQKCSVDIVGASESNHILMIILTIDVILIAVCVAAVHIENIKWFCTSKCCSLEATSAYRIKQRRQTAYNFTRPQNTEPTVSTDPDDKAESTATETHIQSNLHKHKNTTETRTVTWDLPDEIKSTDEVLIIE